MAARVATILGGTESFANLTLFGKYLHVHVYVYKCTTSVLAALLACSLVAVVIGAALVPSYHAGRNCKNDSTPCQSSL